MKEHLYEKMNIIQWSVVVFKPRMDNKGYKRYEASLLLGLSLGSWILLYFYVVWRCCLRVDRLKPEAASCKNEQKNKYDPSCINCTRSYPGFPYCTLHTANYQLTYYYGHCLHLYRDRDALLIAPITLFLFTIESDKLHQQQSATYS